MVPQPEETTSGRTHNVLKRLKKKGLKRGVDDLDDVNTSREPGSDAGPSLPEAKRPKTGLKLKIKFNGAILNNKPADPTLQSFSNAVQAELSSLGLPEEDWLKPGPAEWRELRDSPHSQDLPNRGCKEGVHGAERPRNTLSKDSDIQPQSRKHETSKVAQSTAYQEQLHVANVDNAQTTVASEPLGRDAPSVGVTQVSNAHEPLEEAANGRQIGGSKPEADRGAETEEQRAKSSPANAKEGEQVGKHASALPAPSRILEEARPASRKVTGLVGPACTSPRPSPTPSAVDEISRPGLEANPTEDPAQPANLKPEKTSAQPARPVTEEPVRAKRKSPERVESVPLANGRSLPVRESGELATKASASKPHQEDKRNGHIEENAHSHSSTSSSSSETDSGDDRDHSSASKRTRSRSREAGERSDSDLRSRRYSRPSPPARSRFARSRSRSLHSARNRHGGWSESQERQRKRDVERDRDRERERTRERDREREDYARHRRRLEEQRRSERSRSARHDSSRRSDRHQHRQGSYREDSTHSDYPRGRRSPARDRAHRRGEELETRRSASQSLHRVRDVGHQAEKPEIRRTDDLPAGQPPLPPEEPATASQQATPMGFADAWNMLHGCAKEDWGTEADIDKLHNSATNAKRNIDNISKATNGKHTFENLVALMRDSYLKYMQVSTIWETIARLPNPPPNRNRARLADEGGMYPSTIGLMRQVASECKTCPANTEASALLRILAERLMAIMQMRVAQVQRAKVHQDRQFLLSCPGAPKVDHFGRKLPGQENPGETYQRPSPTDSNASNNTSEQAVALPPSGLQGGLKSPARGGMTKAALAPSNHTAKPLGVRGGKIAKSHEHSAAAKAKRARSATPTPPNIGRDDAWAVHPPAWEIPPTMFESEIRSWSILGGLVSYTMQFRSHAPELQKLMQFNSPLIKEAAGMLGFLDMGLGMSNIGVVMQLSQNILDLILKIQSNGSSFAAPPVPVFL